MRNQFQSQSDRIKLMIRSVRMFTGLTQIELSQKLGVAQSTISKIESGKMVPEISLWMALMEFAQIQNGHCFRDGFIELPKDGIDNEQLLEAFKVPAKYRMDCNIRLRKVLPLINYLREVDGGKVDAYLKYQGIKPEFLMLVNSSVSVQLLKDIVDFSVKSKVISSITDLSCIPAELSLGSLSSVYESSYSGSEIIDMFIRKIAYYGNDLSYSFLNEKVPIIRVERNESSGFKSSYSEEVESLYMRYSLYYPFNLQRLSKDSSAKFAQVKQESEKTWSMVLSN